MTMFVPYVNDDCERTACPRGMPIISIDSEPSQLSETYKIFIEISRYGSFSSWFMDVVLDSLPEQAGGVMIHPFNLTPQFHQAGGHLCRSVEAVEDR